MRIAALLLLLTLWLPAQSPQSEVRKVLDAQTEAWNRGDLESFMNGYWHSPDLTFYGNGSVTKGWQQTLDRYRKTYQSQGKEMGHLDFPEFDIQPLGADYALARGRWHLRFHDGKEATGMTSLTLRKFPDGWRIIHDHSSS